MMFDLDKTIINNSSTVREAIALINTISSKNYQTLFVLDDQSKLLGTITDGDIRRGLLNNAELSSPVEMVFNRSFKYIRTDQLVENERIEYRNLHIILLPVIDEEGRFVKLIDLSKEKRSLPIDVIIMAGGEGKRLRPLTEKVPKPLLEVGGVPIIERNINRLCKYGIKNINISVNYLGSMLIEYFKDGSEKDLNISYIEEEEYLGTVGSTVLVDQFENETILIMNSDLLTNIDFEDMYNEFMTQSADMMIASIPYKVSIPYAVLETENGCIKALKEKPDYTYYSNAGIYMLKKSMINVIPRNRKYDATDLIEQLLVDGRKVMPYTITGYWLDIGKHEDFQKAQNDIKHIKFD